MVFFEAFVDCTVWRWIFLKYIFVLKIILIDKKQKSGNYFKFYCSILFWTDCFAVCFLSHSNFLGLNFGSFFFRGLELRVIYSFLGCWNLCPDEHHCQRNACVFLLGSKHWLSLRLENISWQITTFFSLRSFAPGAIM